MTPTHPPASHRPFHRFAWPRSARTRAKAGVALAVLLAGPAAAEAGTTLLSRSSTVHAMGDGGPGVVGFELAESQSHFEHFADHAGMAEPTENGLIAVAYQYSVPGLLGDSGVGLEGAFAEGHVTADVVGGAGMTSARSEMELRFQVDDHPSNYTVGAMLGATGAGSVTLQLTPFAPGTAEAPIFAVTVDSTDADSSQSLDQSGLLAPGQYVLRVHADAAAFPHETVEADAYFNLNIQLSEAFGGGVPNGGEDGGTGGGGGTGGVDSGGTPPAAVPFPAAVFSGGGMLGALAVAGLLRRRRWA